MDIERSVNVLKTLANGVNPVSGEMFPPQSPYNHPEIIRSLYTCIEQLKAPIKKGKMSTEQRQEENLKKGLPKNAGLPWTEDAKQMLAEGFKNGVNVVELASAHARTKGSVVAQLQNLGLISVEQAKQL